MLVSRVTVVNFFQTSYPYLGTDAVNSETKLSVTSLVPFFYSPAFTFQKLHT